MLWRAEAARRRRPFPFRIFTVVDDGELVGDIPRSRRRAAAYPTAAVVRPEICMYPAAPLSLFILCRWLSGTTAVGCGSGTCLDCIPTLSGYWRRHISECIVQKPTNLFSNQPSDHLCESTLLDSPEMQSNANWLLGETSLPLHDLYSFNLLIPFVIFGSARTLSH